MAATDLLIQFNEELAEIGVKAGKSPVTFAGAGIAVLGFTVLFVMAIRKYLNQSDRDNSIIHEVDGRDVDLDVEDPEFSGDDWDIESFDEETQSNPMKDQGPPNLMCGSSDRLFDTSCDELF
jgi:hypothetical protein